MVSIHFKQQPNTKQYTLKEAIAESKEGVFKPVKGQFSDGRSRVFIGKIGTVLLIKEGGSIISLDPSNDHWKNKLIQPTGEDMTVIFD